MANDTKGQILSALGYDKDAIDVAAVFAEKVQDNVLEVQDNVLGIGELKPYEGKFNTSYGALIKNGELHVFTATTANGDSAYVLPVVGRGLWGGLWGYIAVDRPEVTKVLGTYFYHESETAGLGARIGEKWFQDQFIGKPIFDKDGEVALSVVKAGSAKSEYEVDGVTGATLTSNGVAAMVKEGLSAYMGSVFDVLTETEARGSTKMVINEDGTVTVLETDADKIDTVFQKAFAILHEPVNVEQ